MVPEYVIVQSPPGQAAQLFLLFHRSGDNPVAMSEIGMWFARDFPQAKVVSVGSPHPLASGGSEWYSEQQGSLTLQQKNIDNALSGFIRKVEEWQAESGVTPAATALIGFSQGGTLILEALKHSPDLAGRAVIFSGRYNTPPETGSRHTTVHLIHGDEDEVIPLQHAQQAEEWIVSTGGDVTLDLVEDLPHAISERSLQLALHHLKYTIPKRYFDEALSGSTPEDKDVITLM